ncbi:DUF1559 family PulG-like putative transporter [Rubripirellula reticaptiva]|nr:DUF1559 domain-containing protein [Rubripirellula reticaptiva]
MKTSFTAARPESAATVALARFRIHTILKMIACCATIFVVGCGPSKEDLIAKAMRRKRASSDDVDPTPVQVATPVAASTPAPQPAPISESKTAAVETAVPKQTSKAIAGVEQKPLTPIDQRKPTEPLSATDRRRMAVDNLKKIHEAMAAYVADHGEFPYYTMESSGGISTFSWRVALLPYLGYQELYDKFNHERPWDYPENKELLTFIPPEYVSPERFDTNTNFLAPLANFLIFHDFTERDEESNEQKVTKVDRITDGLDNTILLLEVDDDFSVPWTKPEDYRLFGGEGGQRAITRGFGHLRGDGALAIWGNGWPFSLSDDLPFQQLYPAFTYAGNERQPAAVIHREVSFDSVVDRSETVTSSIIADTSGSPTQTMSLDSIPIVRREVPNSIELANAEEQFQSIFGDRIRAARDRMAKDKLAVDILKASATMQADLAGTYVMQTAAMKLGQLAGSVDTLLSAVDARVATFEVDAYKTNTDALLSLAKSSSQMDSASVNGTTFLQRAVYVVWHAVENDDYDTARILVRSADRMIEVSRSNRLPKMLGRLGVVLAEAERQYANAKDQLAAYRVNPDDGEAAATFGRYLCFIKGDWDRGLPLLVGGGPEPLRRASRIDLKGSETNEDEVAIADSWWELASQARPGVYRQGALDRAAHWYRNVFEKMPDSLDKIHVKARLGDLEKVDLSSPLAITAQLAKQSGVDLSIKLSDVAFFGRKGGLLTASNTEIEDVNN